jgi:hypothetical protein
MFDFLLTSPFYTPLPCAVFVCTNGVQRLCVDKAALETDRVVRVQTLPEDAAAGTGLVLCCAALYCNMLCCTI